ncbi:MAG: hypothetical protein IPL96_07030 [Holophagaceae bacterium]|nr:hypothetical protein [Holophagaceae bacterium]
MTGGDAAPRILRPQAARLRPVLAALIPATAALDVVGVERVLARVDARLAQEEPRLQRQLKLFIRVLWWLPFLGTLRTFGGLPPERREAFLRKVQDGPVPKLRVGLWGLRTLLFLGWYGDPEVQQQLGYRPNARGWEALAHGNRRLGDRPGDRREGPR